MKKVLKRITASLMSGLMLCSSIYTIAGSANAASNEVQPRGMWAVYGDVDNNGKVNIADAVAVAHAINKFKELTGDSRLPLSYAIARPEVYYLNVPQAADIDGNGYIDNNDREMITFYSAEMHDKAGRCGQPFYIN